MAKRAVAAKKTTGDGGRKARLRSLTADLMMIPGLSGYEGRVRRRLAAEMKALGIASRSDRLGNLIATLPGDDKAPSVMLFAHMDQLGLVVRKVEASGLIRVERLGGVPDKALPAQSVLFCVVEGRDVPGVIANKSHHATSQEEKFRVLPYAELYIDAGFASTDEVLAAVTAEPITERRPDGSTLSTGTGILPLVRRDGDVLVVVADPGVHPLIVASLGRAAVLGPGDDAALRAALAEGATALVVVGSAETWQAATRVDRAPRSVFCPTDPASADIVLATTTSTLGPIEVVVDALAQTAE